MQRKWEIIQIMPVHQFCVVNFLRHGQTENERFSFPIVGWALLIVYKGSDMGDVSHNEVRPLVQFPDSLVARPVFEEDGAVSCRIDAMECFSVLNE